MGGVEHETLSLDRSFHHDLGRPDVRAERADHDEGWRSDLTGQNTHGTGTIRDTTVHTTFGNGVVVSTSTGTDGKPNGGAGNSSGGTAGITTPPAH